MNWLIFTPSGFCVGTQQEALQATRHADAFEDAVAWVDSHRAEVAREYGTEGGRPPTEPWIDDIAARVVAENPDLDVEALVDECRRVESALEKISRRDLRRALRRQECRRTKPPFGSSQM